LGLNRLSIDWSSRTFRWNINCRMEIHTWHRNWYWRRKWMIWRKRTKYFMISWEDWWLSLIYRR